MDTETIPRNAKGFDFRDNPMEMDGTYLAELSHKLYAKAMRYDCTSELYERAMQLRNEVIRRMHMHHSNVSFLRNLLQSFSGREEITVNELEHIVKRLERGDSRL